MAMVSLLVAKYQSYENIKFFGVKITWTYEIPKGGLRLMGATFSNIHIRNNKKINPDQFIQKLSNYMKTKGFIPATEDESELWYSFAPSKSNDWIALHSSQNEEPDDEAFKEDAKGLAKSMKTISILAKVIDSDMVILDYFDETGTLKNQVVKGSSAYHDADSIGNPDF